MLWTRYNNPVVLMASPKDRALDGDDDLADLGIRLHVAMSFGDLVEREALVDAWVELSIGETFEDVLLRFCEERRIRNDLEEGVGLDREMFVECYKKRIGGRVG